jgi:hypothetical protein
MVCRKSHADASAVAPLLAIVDTGKRANPVPSQIFAELGQVRELHVALVPNLLADALVVGLIAHLVEDDVATCIPPIAHDRLNT